jgi:hypothetical protein
VQESLKTTAIEATTNRTSKTQAAAVAFMRSATPITIATVPAMP